MGVEKKTILYAFASSFTPQAQNFTIHIESWKIYPREKEKGKNTGT